jgi:hypothetical protein
MERQAVTKTNNTSSPPVHLQRQSAQAPASRNPIVALQQSIGNQAVQRLLRSRYIQTRLKGRVIQRKCECGGQGGPGECAECEGQRQLIQRKPDDKPEAAQKTEVKCPPQKVTMSGAKCGEQYGAVGKYCYKGAKNWWFKENVKNGPSPLCQEGEIDQTTDPIQSSSGCVTDLIFNNNGPPEDVAPCTDTTFQTVFAGPTEAEVEKCQYKNTQVIKVTKNSKTPPSGKVITSSAKKSTECKWS